MSTPSHAAALLLSRGGGSHRRVTLSSVLTELVLCACGLRKTAPNMRKDLFDVDSITDIWTWTTGPFLSSVLAGSTQRHVSNPINPLNLSVVHATVAFGMRANEGGNQACSILSGRLCSNVALMHVQCMSSWPDTKPGEFYRAFRLLGLIRMRQVLQSHAPASAFLLLLVASRPGACAVVLER